MLGARRPGRSEQQTMLAAPRAARLLSCRPAGARPRQLRVRPCATQPLARPPACRRGHQADVSVSGARLPARVASQRAVPPARVRATRLLARKKAQEAEPDEEPEDDEPDVPGFTAGASLGGAAQADDDEEYEELRVYLLRCVCARSAQIMPRAAAAGVLSRARAAR